MELNSYGINLKKIEYKDIEMIRMWRNSHFVKEFMEFRGYITIEMQKKWFQQLGSDNHYFIVYFRDYPIGLSYIKDVRDNIGYFGIFIADKESLETLPMVSYKIMLSMLDFAFDDLELDLIEASILKSNPRASRFNESVGFQILEDQALLEKQHYLLNRKRYEQKSQKIKKVISRT